MKPETRLFLFLLFLSPAVGELLSGSSPPLQFFHPFGLTCLALFYGGGTVLIREARARWHLQWPVLFVAIAYGVLEEGTMMQSFFNPNHADLGAQSRYGMFMGIQWPWTIELIFYHATMSTLIPITIADLLWPDCRNLPLLRRRGLILTSLGVALVTVLLMLFVWSEQKKQTHPYHPDPVMLIGSVAVVGLLVLMAYWCRNRTASTQIVRQLPPFVFAIAGFFSQAANVLVPNKLAEAKVPATTTLAVQLLGAIAFLLFIFFQICNRDLTKRHLVSLVSGSLLFFILLTPLHEFCHLAGPKPTQGMLAVGIASLILLVLWKRRVLRDTRGN